MHDANRVLSWSRTFILISRNQLCSMKSTHLLSYRLALANESAVVTTVFNECIDIAVVVSLSDHGICHAVHSFQILSIRCSYIAVHLLCFLTNFDLQFVVVDIVAFLLLCELYLAKLEFHCRL